VRVEPGAHSRADAKERRRILVVDDDEPVVLLLREYLRLAGYDVDTAGDGSTALRRIHVGRPDLVILDVGLPGLDGWQVLARTRVMSDVPVLMLTARDSEFDKVRGLRGGADDYVTKPFGRHELLARIATLLRRAPAAPDVADVYADARLSIDFTQRVARVANAELSLTPREFELLSTLARHPNQVLSHGQIAGLAWSRDDGESHGEVKLYVSRLRRKLGPRLAGAIETVRGFGYRYRPPG
jgi:DNA-binding response OmpR family regulator